MKKSVSVLLIIVSVIVTLAVAATAGLSVMTYLKVSAMETKAEEETPPEGNVGEDDIKIGGEYWIRSTKQISDAYLAGDSSALSEKDKETYDMASEILAGVITDGMSDYEKEQAVFEWMNGSIGEDTDVNVLVRDDVSTDNPHGVLSGRQAVCVGYATTFRLFMQMLDIPCMVVHDTSLVHSWDLVQIGGHWYHVDLYSANGASFPEQYLNRTDSIQSQLGSDWDDSFYPEADDPEYCYVYRNSKEAEDIYVLPGAVRKAIDDNENLVALRITGGENEMIAAQRMLETIYNRVSNSYEYQNIYITSCVTLEGDDEVFAFVTIENYDYDGDDDYDDVLSEEEIQQIDDSIDDAFGDLTEMEYNDDYYNYAY